MEANTRGITSIVITAIIGSIMIIAVFLPVLANIMSGMPELPEDWDETVAIIKTLVMILPVVAFLGVLIYVATGILGSGNRRNEE